MSEQELIVEELRSDAEDISRFYACAEGDCIRWRLNNAARHITKQAEHIAALEAAQTWQPIETAPRNGDRILLYWTHAGTCVGYFFDGSEECGHRGWRGNGDDFAPYNQKDCTHWMPLPERPDRAALKGGSK